MRADRYFEGQFPKKVIMLIGILRLNFWRRYIVIEIWLNSHKKK